MNDTPPNIPDAELLMRTMKAALKHETLRQHPHLQAAAIADHYTSLATLALTLRNLANLREASRSKLPDVEHAIEWYENRIKDHHYKDFGIKLSWGAPDEKEDDVLPEEI